MILYMMYTYLSFAVFFLSFDNKFKMMIRLKKGSISEQIKQISNISNIYIT